MNEKNNKKIQKGEKLPIIENNKKSNKLKLNNIINNKNKESSTLSSIPKN